MRLLQRAIAAAVTVAALLATDGAQSTARSAVPASEPRFDADRTVAMHHDNGPIVVLAAGDIADCADAQGLEQAMRILRKAVGLSVEPLPPNAGMVQTSDLIAADPSTMVLALGDLVYPGGEPRVFQDCYDRFWGRFRDRTWPSPGNHDYVFRQGLGYYDYWTGRAGPDRLGYYAVEVGDWLLLSLNSEIEAGPGSAQATWLQERLDTSDAACTLAFFHRPAFAATSRKGGENARQLFTTLAQAGVSLVLNGHDHFYERTLPLDRDGSPSAGGVQTFVVGTGGRRLSNSVTAIVTSATLLSDAFGVLRLELNPDSYSWRFLQVPDGAVLDQGSRDCTG